MKLAVILIGLLLIIGAANSVPVTEGDAEEMPVGAEEIPEGTEELPDNPQNNTGMLALIRYFLG